MRAAAVLLVLLLATGCTGDGSEPAASGGAPTPTPTVTSPSPTATAPTATSPTATEPTATAPATEAPAGSADSQPCPARYDGDGVAPRVPELPTTATEGRLAPDADPVEVVLCRYSPLGDDPSTLQGRPVRIDEGLQQVRLDLVLPSAAAPRTCPADAEPQVPHLARLTYADGELWLAAVHDAADCAGAGNGAFTTAAHLGDQLAASYDAGAWVPRTAVS